MNWKREKDWVKRVEWIEEEESDFDGFEVVTRQRKVSLCFFYCMLRCVLRVGDRGSIYCMPEHCPYKAKIASFNVFLSFLFVLFFFIWLEALLSFSLSLC